MTPDGTAMPSTSGGYNGPYMMSTPPVTTLAPHQPVTRQVSPMLSLQVKIQARDNLIVYKCVAVAFSSGKISSCYYYYYYTINTP